MSGGRRESQVVIRTIFGTYVVCIIFTRVTFLDFGCCTKLLVVRDFAMGNFGPVLGLGMGYEYREGPGHMLGGLGVRRGSSGIFFGAERLRQGL